MVAILPAGPLQKCRAADAAAGVESYTRYILSLHQFAGYVSIRPEISRFPGSSVLADCQRFLSAPDLWPILLCAGNDPVNPALAATSAPFILRAAACKDSRLCCRVTVKLHQNLRYQSATLNRASLESRSTGASDAVPPRRRKPRFIRPAPSIPHTDTPFSGRCRFRKGEKDRYRGGHDAPENFLLTQAACTAYRLKLPTPQQPATPA